MDRDREIVDHGDLQDPPIGEEVHRARHHVHLTAHGGDGRLRGRVKRGKPAIVGSPPTRQQLLLSVGPSHCELLGVISDAGNAFDRGGRS